ncbi:class I SAM-dependent methyltransferase [Campylobacter jejuni]|nr:class I SAM-dependent methyltransferase [Campylobacter jejuni]EIP5773759.1 class I SAM-dependent methyltransferase [Campylobacter jejuni]
MGIFNHNAKIWEDIYSHKEWGKYPNENLIRFIAKNFYSASNRNKIHILELGFGTGANLWFCAREGFKISGIEWSQTAVKTFQQRLKDENLNPCIGDLKIGDYEQKLDEFEDESFDAWFDVYSLAYNDFAKTKNIIEKVMKKLKKNGKFFSITPSLNNEGFYQENTKQYNNGRGGGYHSCIPKIGYATSTGIIRYCDLWDIQKLYNGENYKLEDFTLLSLKKFNTIFKELYIIKGKKYKK